MLAITFSCCFQLPPSLVLQQFRGWLILLFSKSSFCLNLPELISVIYCLAPDDTEESLNSGLSATEQRCRDSNKVVCLVSDMRERVQQGLELQELPAPSWWEHEKSQHKDTQMSGLGGAWMPNRRMLTLFLESGDFDQKTHWNVYFRGYI